MPIIDAAVVSIANITRKELLTATVDTHQEILNGVLDQDPQAARAARGPAFGDEPDRDQARAEAV